MTKKIKKILSEVAAQMGKRGGLSGKGVSKIRETLVTTGICKEKQWQPV